MKKVFAVAGMRFLRVVYGVTLCAMLAACGGGGGGSGGGGPGGGGPGGGGNGGGGSGGGTTPPPDPPSITIADAFIDEGNSGTRELSFTVTLSAAATSTVTVEYATADDTASSPEDYVASSGSVSIAAGSQSATIVIAVNGDTDVEPDERFTLTLSDATGDATLANATATGTIRNDDLPEAEPGAALNDTGATTCSNAVNGSLPCADSAAGTRAFPRQDAQYGRDVTHNDDADGRAGFAFTKLDDAGAPLADQSVSYASSPWNCVRDEVTGLVWEVKPDDGGERDRDRRYTWYDSDALRGVAGKSGADVCSSDEACDTQAYVDRVNALELCGFDDWRLPTQQEWASLLDYGADGALFIDTNYFPDTDGREYWTSSSRYVDAWTLNPSNGLTRLRGKHLPLGVRLVSEGEL